MHGDLEFDIGRHVHLLIDGGKVFGEVQVDEVSIHDGSVVKGNITCRNMAVVGGANINIAGKVSIGASPVSPPVAEKSNFNVLVKACMYGCALSTIMMCIYMFICMRV